MGSSPGQKKCGGLGYDYVLGCCGWQVGAPHIEEIIVSQLGGKL